MVTMTNNRKIKICVTERGDAALDLSWQDKIDSVNGAVLITKRLSKQFCEAVLALKDRVIIHATVTGYGQTIVEPNCPTVDQTLTAAKFLLSQCFPLERIVIRIDPIIPTEKGIARAKDVFIKFIDAGFERFRVSIIDMYPHVRDRFIQARLPLPYGNDFAPTKEQIAAVDAMLAEVKTYYRQNRISVDDLCELHIQSCAEPGLTQAEPSGCISEYDLRILGYETSPEDFQGYQRTHCKCFSGKTELLTQKHPCAHNCLYCFWQH